MNSKTRFFNYSINNTSVKQIVAEIISSIDKGEKKWLACFNPHSYYVSKIDYLFSEALRKADWLIPDGIGVVFFLNLLAKRKIGRVTGPDVFFELNERLNNLGGYSCFFFGSHENVLKVIGNKMEKDFPNVKISGYYSPPFVDRFSEEESEKIISLINKHKPEILWVSLTAPKQEKFIFENLDRLDFRFCAGVGALFDFYSGNVKRPNKFFILLGLEWLPRLLRKPKRLWRRTFISAPVFILDSIKFLIYNKFRFN
uniref:WecB/TagA/CpsF family glycosyltransferase n=1 Tax=Algoriphagus sp. TaxID=1872435 RepID=UPI004048C657